MFFQSLDDRLKHEIMLLQADKVFQDRFGHDKVLDDLDRQMIDPKRCFAELKQVLFSTYTVNGRTYKPLTPKIWAYLWCINSPITKTGVKISEQDINIFFFLLQNGVTADFLNIFPSTINFIKELGISYSEAFNDMQHITETSFYPLSMFPQTSASLVHQDPVFDVDWLTSICSRVHTMTGYTPDKIMDMPLNLVCYYYIQYARQQGEKLEHRPPQEILVAQDYRACELIVDYLVETGKLDASERDATLKIISTNPEKI